MVTSDFRPEVEIRQIRACAMKNTQYTAHLSALNVRKSPADSRMRNEKYAI